MLKAKKRICDYKGVNIEREKVSHTLPSNEIGQGALKQMGFIPHGNNFIHKGDVPVEEGEEDAPIPDELKKAHPHIWRKIATLTRRMEETYNLQAIRHQELLSLHATQHEQMCGLISDIDNRLTNVELHLEEEYDDGSSEEF
ncbi:hypothetical protein V8G54_005897 [Vigna mungo]|uniref:Uncharacterized protein n=1 Tax=Vigna mungo TaxID=3915 RepID=A0AAQ3NZ25_VIGMU